MRPLDVALFEHVVSKERYLSTSSFELIHKIMMFDRLLGFVGPIKSLDDIVITPPFEDCCITMFVSSVSARMQQQQQQHPNDDKAIVFFSVD